MSSELQSYWVTLMVHCLVVVVVVPMLKFTSWQADPSESTITKKEVKN